MALKTDLFNNTVSITKVTVDWGRNMAKNDKDLEGGDRTYFKVLFWHLPEVTESWQAGRDGTDFCETWFGQLATGGHHNMDLGTLCDKHYQHWGPKLSCRNNFLENVELFFFFFEEWGTPVWR
jgi:hypothetical protein